MAIPASSLTCGNIGCPGLNGAGQIITHGLAGRGCNLLVGFFHLQIKIKQKDAGPGGIAGPLPEPVIRVVDDQEVDTNLVDVFLTVRWPFMEESRRLRFTMDRAWANVIVNRINQINTFSGEFKVKIDAFNADFKVRLGEFKEEFVAKFKPKK